MRRRLERLKKQVVASPERLAAMRDAVEQAVADERGKKRQLEQRLRRVNHRASQLKSLAEDIRESGEDTLQGVVREKVELEREQQLVAQGEREHEGLMSQCRRLQSEEQLAEKKLTNTLDLQKRLTTDRDVKTKEQQAVLRQMDEKRAMLDQAAGTLQEGSEQVMDEVAACKATLERATRAHTAKMMLGLARAKEFKSSALRHNTACLAALKRVTMTPCRV